MNQHVTLEIKSSCGRVIALYARKRLLTTMNQHMAFQFVWPIACIVALVTTICLLSTIRGLLGLFCKIARLHFHVFSQPKTFWQYDASENLALKKC